MVSVTPEASGAGRRRRGRRHRWVVYVAATVGVLVLALTVAVVLEVAQEASRKVPEFPSLVAHPDTRLHGTVAYVASDGCIHVIAASGTGDRSVHCLDRAQDPEEAKRLGKLIGPQLLWLDDGRLEITMFRMPMGPDDVWHPGSQQVLDVTTGAVEDVPTADLPAAPTKRVGRPRSRRTGARPRSWPSPPTARGGAARGSGRPVAHPAVGARSARLHDLVGRVVARRRMDRGGRLPDPRRRSGREGDHRVLVQPADTGLGPEYLRYTVTDRTFAG